MTIGSTTSAQYEPFRQKVQAFLAEHLPPHWQGAGSLSGSERGQLLRHWRQALHSNDLLAPSWPTRYGGGGEGPLADVILAQEFISVGAPTLDVSDRIGIWQLGNTILHLGTEEQRRRYLPAMLSGKHVWCQGFSEPDAGSDLAGLRCTAERVGDEWRIRGQKIWTTAGESANMIYLLARTDRAAPKHKGLSLLLVERDQPGVTMRPIRMMSGESEFCEVFYDDARCPSDAVVGPVNGGWSVAMRLLGFERGQSATTLPALLRAEFDRLIATASQLRKTDDPMVRQRLARAFTSVRIIELVGMRIVEEVLSGGAPGPEATIFKLLWSEHHRNVTDLALSLLDARGMLMEGRPKGTHVGPDLVGGSTSSRAWGMAFMHARAGTIYAGTSEIQRNIVAKFLLGLPDEPQPASPS